MTSNPSNKLLECRSAMKTIFKCYCDIFLLQTNNGENQETIKDMIKTSSSLRLASKKFNEFFCEEIQRRFETIEITNPIPHDDNTWLELSSLTISIRESVVSFNGFKCICKDIISIIRHLSENLQIKIVKVDLFPINRDLMGDPAQNCRALKIYIEVLRAQIINLLGKECVNYVVTTSSKLPKFEVIPQLTLSSSFLEYTANSKPVSSITCMEEFLELREELFGNLQCEELTMVMTDFLRIHDSKLASETLDVPSFIPLELLKMTIQSLRPSVLILKLRSECATSLCDGYRCDWDDYDVFTSCVLFNSPSYSIFENQSLGNEEELANITLVIDTSAALSRKAHLSKSSFQYTGTDILTLFPMKNIVIGYVRRLDDSVKTKSQILDTFNDLLYSFWRDIKLCKGRNLYFKLFFENDITNSDRISKRILRKSIPRSFENKMLKIEYNVKEAIDRFNMHSSQYLNERYKNVLGLDTLVIREHYVSISHHSNSHVIHFDVYDVAHF